MAQSSVIGLLRVLLSANTAEFDSAMKESSKAAARWTKDLKSMGQQATNIGSTLTKAFTLPIVGVGAAVAKLAIDFESSFAGVRKTVNATEPEFAAMAASFRQLSKEIPVNVNELNKLGEAAGALGIPKEEIVEFARVMAELGVTTNLTSDQAADAIARIQNIFGAAGKDTERLASTLVALGNAGASTEKEIVEMAQRIAGAGHTVGLTQAQVLGFASALASVGINAEAGGSAISRIFLKINDAVMSGGKGLQEFARVSNMSAAEFKKAFEKDAGAATTEFIKGLGRLKASGENINATIEGLTGKNIILKDTLFRLAGAGQLLTDQLGVANTAWKDNTALTKEAEERFKTTASQMTLLWNRVKDVGITLGNALLPAIREAIVVLDKLLPLVEMVAKAFTAMPPQLQLAALGFAAALAAAGPLIYAFGQLSLGLASLTAAFTANGIATKAMAGGLVSLRAASAALLGPIGLVGAAAIAATAALTGYIEKRAQAKVTAETLAAQEDSIRLAISRGANALINYTEAVKYNEEWNRKRVGGLKATTEETTKAGTSTKSLATAVDTSTESVKKATKASRDYEQAVEKMRQKTEKMREEAANLGRLLQDMAFNMSASPGAKAAKLGNLLELDDSIEDVKAWIDIWTKGIPVANGITKDTWSLIKSLGEEVDVAFSPAKLTKIQQFGQGLGQTLMQAFTGGGDAGKSIGAFLGQSLFDLTGITKKLTQGLTSMLGQTIGGALGAIIPGLGPLIGSLLGPILNKFGGWFKGLFGGGEGRDMVEDFAKSMGGFDALRTKLNDLGDEGEQLWIALTQGVGKNNPEQAKAAIEAVQAALAKLKDGAADAAAASADVLAKQLEDILGMRGKAPIEPRVTHA